MATPKQKYVTYTLLTNPKLIISIFLIRSEVHWDPEIEDRFVSMVE